MTEVIEFPFKNVLNQKIDTVTSDMLMAILASQSNQDFFHTIINKGSHLFQHRQLREEPYWYDLIKVYVGVPAADTFIVGIDESDELSEKITAVPFGLLAEIAEISDVMIPISLPIDQAAVLDGENKRGLMYQWTHTNTDEFIKELLGVWHSLVTRSPVEQIHFEQIDEILDAPHDHTAILGETAALRVLAKHEDKKRRTLLLSALHLTKTFAENDDDVCEVLMDESNEDKPNDIAERFQNFDLVDLYNWIVNELTFAGLFGGFQGFLEYCRETMNDAEFLSEEQENYSWLQVITLNTEASSFEIE